MTSDAVWQNWGYGASLNESSEVRDHVIWQLSYGEFGKRIRGMNRWIKGEREKGDWP